MLEKLPEKYTQTIPVNKSKDNKDFNVILYTLLRMWILF